MTTRNRSEQAMALVVAIIAAASSAIAAVTASAVSDSELAAPWRKYWAENRARCIADIEANRKADVSLVMKDASGRILKNAACDVRQVSSDFVFGCNGLCLGQLGPTNAAYEAKLSEFFNLVTTTFCPGIMEPKKGQYRFDASSRARHAYEGPAAHLRPLASVMGEEPDESRGGSVLPRLASPRRGALRQERLVFRRCQRGV